MKRVLFFLFVAFLLTSCKNDQTSEGGKLTTIRTSVPLATAPPDTKETQLLIRNYWIFEFFVVENNQELSNANRGKWYKLNPDGSFIAGRWEDEDTRTKGTWSLFYGGEFPVLHLIAENSDLTGEYQLQGVSEDQEYMSWVGTSRYGQKGYSAKVMNLLTPPTRKQFGFEGE